MNKKDIIDFFDRFAPSWDADLIHDNELSALLQEYFDMTTAISNENMYVVSGVKRTR